MARFMEEVNTRRGIFLSLSKLGCGLREFVSGKFHLHLTLKQVGLIATTFDETRIMTFSLPSPSPLLNFPITKAPLSPQLFKDPKYWPQSNI